MVVKECDNFMESKSVIKQKSSRLYNPIKIYLRKLDNFYLVTYHYSSFSPNFSCPCRLIFCRVKSVVELVSRPFAMVCSSCSSFFRQFLYLKTQHSIDIWLSDLIWRVDQLTQTNWFFIFYSIHLSLNTKFFFFPFPFLIWIGKLKSKTFQLHHHIHSQILFLPFLFLFVGKLKSLRPFNLCWIKKI